MLEEITGEDNERDENDLLLPLYLKFLPSSNFEIKKLCCSYLIKFSKKHNSVSSSCGENILFQDSRDPNPKIRSLSIDTLCSLPGVTESLILNCISSGLHDSIPQVRKTSVIGAGKLLHRSPSLYSSSDLVDKLYQKIKDSDSSVVAFSLQTLQFILKESGGLVISVKMATYLLNRLVDFSELELCYVLETLENLYTFSQIKEASFFLQTLDPFLQGAYGPVFLASSKLCYKAVIFASFETPNSLKDFSKRLAPEIGFIMNSKAQIFQLTKIKLLENLSKWKKLHFDEENFWENFKIKSLDSKEMALGKMQYLGFELKQSFRAPISDYLFHIFLQPSFDYLKDFILNILSSIDDYQMNYKLVSELITTCEKDSIIILKHIRQLSNYKNSNFPSLASKILLLLFQDSSASLTQNDVSQGLWLISSWSSHLKESPYVLESIIRHYPTIISSLSSELLLCGLRVFATYPSITQNILSSIFHIVLKENPETLPKISYYIQILQNSRLYPLLLTSISEKNSLMISYSK